MGCGTSHDESSKEEEHGHSYDVLSDESLTDSCPEHREPHSGDDGEDAPPANPVPVDPNDLHVVVSTWAELKDVYTLQQLGDRFYEIEFDGNPELKYTIFHGVNMDRQAHKLMLMIDAAMEYLKEKDKFVYILEDLGKRHGGFGVEVKHYDIVALHLLTMLKVLMEEQRTKALEARAAGAAAAAAAGKSDGGGGDGGGGGGVGEVERSGSGAATPCWAVDGDSDAFTPAMYTAWLNVYSKMRDAMVGGLTSDMGNWWLLEYKKKETTESVRRLQGFWGRFKDGKVADLVQYMADGTLEPPPGATDADAVRFAATMSDLASRKKDGEEVSAVDIVFESTFYPELQYHIREMLKSKDGQKISGNVQSVYYPSASSALPRSHRYAAVTDDEESAEAATVVHAVVDDVNHHDHLPVTKESLIQPKAAVDSTDTEGATAGGPTVGSDGETDGTRTEQHISKAKAKHFLLLLDATIRSLTFEMSVAERSIKVFGKKFYKACIEREVADATAEAAAAGIGRSPFAAPLSMSLVKATVLLMLEKKQVREPFSGQHQYSWVWMLDLAAETTRRSVANAAERQ